MADPDPARRARRGLLALLVLFTALALAYGVRVPLWEAPDAIWHYHFVAHLAGGGGLPTRADQGLDAPWRQQGSQPPLYYIATAPLVAAVDPADGPAVIRNNPHAAVGVAAVGNANRMVHTARERWPWHGTVLAARLVGLAGIPFGWLAVVGTWGLARETWPARPSVALAAAGLAALNPQLVFLSSAINNDIAVIGTAALALWAMARLVRRGPAPRRLVALGAALGLAALAKLSGLWLLPLAALAVAGAAVMHRFERTERVTPGTRGAWDAGGERDTETAGATGGRAAGRHARASSSAAVQDGARPPVRLWRLLLRDGLLVAGPWLLVAGWWYARNWWLFGDPTGLPVMLSVMQPRLAPPTSAELIDQAVGVWKSYWAVFGWYNVVAPGAVYALYTLLTVLGLGGLAVRLRRRRPTGRTGLLIGLSAGWVGLLCVALYMWAQVRFPQGRLLLPAAPALSTLVAAGWLTLAPALARPRWLTAAGAGLAALVIGLLAWTIGPAYAATPPTVLETEAAAATSNQPSGPSSGPSSGSSPSRSPGASSGPQSGPSSEASSSASGPAPPATFGDRLMLRSAAIEATRSRTYDGWYGVDGPPVTAPGQTLALELAWQPLRALEVDYSVFVHLVDRNGLVVAQRDSYPQSGRAPTHTWRPTTSDGRSLVYADRHQLTIPPAAAPCDCRLTVGLYDHATGQRLTTANGRERVDLGAVRVVPAVSADGVPNPHGARFGGHIALAGLQLERRAVRPGQTFDLTLYWRADAPLERDYRVSVQMRRGAAETWAQHDEPPADGARPTSSWTPGEVVVDHHPVRVYEDAPPGVYTLYVIMYHPEDGPLPVDVRHTELPIGPMRVLEAADGAP